jgi:N-acetylmuramoyl-L-alanine amidase
MPTPILGQARTTPERAIRWAVTRGAIMPFAIDLPPLYWREATRIGVRPEVAWVQACHETGFFKYGRAVTPEHHNYCGLKVPDPAAFADDDPRAHARFPSPEVGVLAHLEHLAIYAGCPGFPRSYRKLAADDWTGCADPRHFGWIAAKAPNVEDLGGKWAPSPTYGERLVALLEELMAP